jgi:DNA topoisomerase IA
MTTRRVELDITEVSELLYDLILEHFRTKFGRDAVFENWEVSADMEKEESTGFYRPWLLCMSYTQEEKERLMRKWVDEDYPEATEEQKANLVKLFREV